MTTLLLVALILLDLGLLAAVVVLSRRQEAHVEVALELTEERRLLAELRQAVQEELEAAQSRARETLEKATRLAAEAEHEVKAGSVTMAHEMEGVAGQIASRLEEPLQELAKARGGLDILLKRVEREKAMLQRMVARGEKLARFFDERVPYEEVLHEIESKKYVDARKLLARGQSPALVAEELGMSESEVRLVAGLAGA